MCEVLNCNFDEKFPEIERCLKDATLIAVDTEFSGLLSSPEYKSSLFDSGSERYINLKNNIEQFIVMQVGITTFKYNRDENKYKAFTFTLPIFPRSFGPIDSKFLCQATSFEFLCHYHFDFNKFVYQGVSYLSNQGEKLLRQELSEGSFLRNLERLSLDDEQKLQAECSRVAEWIPSAVQGDTLKLSDSKTYRGGKLVEYVLHNDLRSRFSTIWTHADNGCIRVEKVSAEEHQQLNADLKNEQALQEDVINSALGFSHIYRLLIQLKKPIIGHNLLLDLMIMYNQFHEPLPNNYNVFKKNIHALFPFVYDTKYISFELKRSLNRDVLNSNMLSALFHYFKEGRGSFMALYSPLIEHEENYNPEISDPKFHEAGWDSYCTGFCFIRMIHVIAEKRYGQATEPRPLTISEHLAAVDSMKNRVNIIRGGLSHICLDGPDPKSERPQLLYAQTRKGCSTSISQLAELLAKFGAIDVKPFTRGSALVAVGNHNSARDILQQYRANKDFKVCKYNKWKHSPYVRAALWSGTILSGGLCTWLILRGLSKTVSLSG